ncbi:hypothetical protein UB46_23445 [Burkholderiaceae bacterium 16]|nr:hypothetical protein UB46_23445 [Burkholderiaceae bacterium 16]
MKKLELSSLQADLASINALLKKHSEADDPLGWYQFSERKRELEAAIAALANTHPTEAQVALFFGGAPVKGSRGILADFAGQALDTFQDLVNKRLSTLGGLALRARGPVRGRADAQLLITDIVRGSVGFVLQEASDMQRLVDTPLKDAVDQATELLSHIASTEEEVFESASDELDDRTLITMQRLFKLLDESRATLRVVDGEKDFLLDSRAVSRARQRVEAIQIEERDDTVEGFLFLLPETRRFDLTNDAEGIQLLYRGMVDRGALPAAQAEEGVALPLLPLSAIVGRRWRVTLHRKDVSQRGRVRTSYTLVRLVEPL